MREPITVGLSGGVDSAVAALRLLEAGHPVDALFMKNWEEDDDAEYCAAAQDLADAKAVAAHLGIELNAVNFASEYWDRVFENFLHEYRAGRTPNPDILCNREIKFRAFLDHALSRGAAAIATGHYARIEMRDGRAELHRGRDEDKDQTYFLHTLDADVLARARFPLGELTKPGVRAIARAAGLPNHDRRDSTGICFIGERRFADFLGRYVERAPGPIETVDGAVIGEHAGLAFYTLGQRQGLGVGGVAGAREAAWYVVAKEPARNALIVAQQHDHPRLMHTRLTTDPAHWIDGTAPDVEFRASARIRHRQPLQACVVHAGNPDGRLDVAFDAPQRAATPGQSVVFYAGTRCLGGAVIDRVP